MLWAATGRTPHYIKSPPCWLTIPPRGGGQSNQVVHFFKENRLFGYLNWTTFSSIWRAFGNAANDIKLAMDANISSELDNKKSGIIMTWNEKTNRAFLEVWYMLENMLLQTRSLGISYHTKIFMDEEARKLKTAGIQAAVVAFPL